MEKNEGKKIKKHQYQSMKKNNDKFVEDEVGGDCQDGSQYSGVLERKYIRVGSLIRE